MLHDAFSAFFPPSLITSVYVRCPFSCFLLLTTGGTEGLLFESQPPVTAHFCCVHLKWTLRIALRFFPPCIESEITEKTITLFRCVLCDALSLMHNWWASMRLFPELLGDMWGSKEERLHKRNIIAQRQIIHGFQVNNQGNVRKKVILSY